MKPEQSFTWDAGTGKVFLQGEYTVEQLGDIVTFLTDNTVENGRYPIHVWVEPDPGPGFHPAFHS